MKHIWSLLFPVFLCTGCLVTEEETHSAIEYSRIEDAQLLHYRPVHRDNANWMIAGAGKTMTVHAGNERIKLSVRHNPDRIVIRKNGTLVGQVEKTEFGAKYNAFNGNDNPLLIQCISAGSAAQANLDMTKIEIKNDKTNFIYRIDNQEHAEDNQYEVRKLNYNNRYSIAPVKNSKLYIESCHHGSESNNICGGTELESPFSPVGVLVFHSELLPLEQRAAVAWFLTKNLLKCN